MVRMGLQVESWTLCFPRLWGVVVAVLGIPEASWEVDAAHLLWLLLLLLNGQRSAGLGQIDLMWDGSFAGP